MASPNSLSYIPRYDLFESFHGPDVRKSFLSHLRKQLNDNGITVFIDQKIQRSQTIAPDITRAIRESRILLVVLSKNYASSRWCLDELVEILRCREEIGQIVMTVFYGVDPSDIREQTGEFGKLFNETCARRTEEERRKWSQALNHVANIAGDQSRDWDDESEMIEKIARDVSNKLMNTTISTDFEDMVGIEAHLDKLQSLLHLDDDEAMIVGICGPAGIGKTIIARALHSRLSTSFQLNCFMENLSGSCNNSLDEHGLKLSLQEKLLSKILKQNGISINHSRVIRDRLSDKKVLIILDGVDDLKQLEALANETNWFGRRSRIIVTTEHQELLKQHGINDIYHVDFPTKEEALEILCRYAFRQSIPLNGFKELAESVVDLCGKLPLGLRVVGSSLRGMNEAGWAKLMRRLETIFDFQDIEQVRRAIKEPPSSNRRIGKSKSRYSTAMAFLVVINLLLEIASVVADQFSSMRKLYFARISLVLSVLSVVLSILELTYKIRVHKARFRCKWLPWFYYPSRGYNRIFGSFTDTVLLFCVVGQFIVSTINYSFTERGRDGPIKGSVWPLFFAIGMVGSKFMEKTPIWKED